MRCNRARRMSAQKASRGISARDEQLLLDHLSACPECAGLEDQLERTWSALGYHPVVEPSQNFLPRFRARLETEQAAPRAELTWRPGLRWQWVALAVCALLVAVLLTRHGQLRHSAAVPDHEVNITADHDRLDEQFLQDLEQTLQYSAADSLSAYDLWPGTAPETTSLEPSKARPTKRMNKKEPS